MTKEQTRANGSPRPPAPVAGSSGVLAGGAKWGAVALLGGFAAFGVWRSASTGRVTHTLGEESRAFEAGAGSGEASRGVRLIDLNRAPTSELELLPGVGPALAGRIVESREADGPFSSVEDLARVRGIGVKTIDRIRPFVLATE